MAVLAMILETAVDRTIALKACRTLEGFLQPPASPAG
jgi:hypothetical protein